MGHRPVGRFTNAVNKLNNIYMSYPNSTESTNLANVAHTAYNQPTPPTPASRARFQSFLVGVKQVFAWLAEDKRAMVTGASSQSIAHNRYFVPATNLTTSVASQTTSGVTGVTPALSVRSFDNTNTSYASVSALSVDTGQAGLYHVSYGAFFNPVAGGGARGSLLIILPSTFTGVDFINPTSGTILGQPRQFAKMEVPTSGTTNQTVISGNELLYLNDGDRILLFVGQNSGGAVVLDSGSYLKMTKLK